MIHLLEELFELGSNLEDADIAASFLTSWKQRAAVVRRSYCK